MRAWHFVGTTLRDGRPVPADGVTLRHDGPLRLCASGLHAKAAWAAAWAAGDAAEEEKQRQQFLSLVEEAFN